MTKKQILILVGFVIILVSIPATMYLVRQTQIFKSKAAFIPKVEFVDATGKVITETTDPNVKLRITKEAAVTSPSPSPSQAPSPSPSPSPPSSPSPSPLSFSTAEAFRDYIFASYGFTDNAASFIKNNSSINVKDLVGSCAGGGNWQQTTKTVSLNCTQHQAAVHELSHVFWHTFRLQNPDLVKGLARDLVRLADGDGSSTAAAFAKTYVYGSGDFKGMYCANNGCVTDVHNITDSDFDLTEAPANAKINDWEIYAGLSSWTMGRFKNGLRALPSFMWKYFEPQFTGTITVTPYYEGGHP